MNFWGSTARKNDSYNYIKGIISGYNVNKKLNIKKQRDIINNRLLLGDLFQIDKSLLVQF